MREKSTLVGVVIFTRTRTTGLSGVESETFKKRSDDTKQCASFPQPVREFSFYEDQNALKLPGVILAMA